MSQAQPASGFKAAGQELQIEYVRIGDLKPYGRNARTHSRKQLRQLAASMREFGFTNPVLIDNEILAAMAGWRRPSWADGPCAMRAARNDDAVAEAGLCVGQHVGLGEVCTPYTAASKFYHKDCMQWPIKFVCLIFGFAGSCDVDIDRRRMVRLQWSGAGGPRTEGTWDEVFQGW